MPPCRAEHGIKPSKLYQLKAGNTKNTFFPCLPVTKVTLVTKSLVSVNKVTKDTKVTRSLDTKRKKTAPGGNRERF